MEIHFLQTESSDIIILGNKNEIALIDTGSEEQYDHICDYIKHHFFGTITIKFILNTHFHQDNYGCISKLTENFPVEKVYLKEYSGLDCTTAWETPADDEYRQAEMEKFQKLKTELIEKNLYVSVEDIENIYFGDGTLKLFNTKNIIQEIYDDKRNAETLHKIMFSENINSLAILLNIDDHYIFFGGDCNDLPQPHYLADRMLYQIAKRINKKIDLYIVPNYETCHTDFSETLDIFKPKTAVFDKSEEYISKKSDILTHLKKVNPKVQLFFNKNCAKVFDTDRDLGISETARWISWISILFVGLAAGAIYLNNVSSFFAYIILSPIYLILLLVPPICFLTVPVYLLLGVSIYKWLKKGKIIWIILNATIFIPLFIYLLYFIDCSMGI